MLIFRRKKTILVYRVTDMLSGILCMFYECKNILANKYLTDTKMVLQYRYLFFFVYVFSGTESINLRIRLGEEHNVCF